MTSDDFFWPRALRRIRVLGGIILAAALLGGCGVLTRRTAPPVWPAPPPIPSAPVAALPVPAPAPMPVPPPAAHMYHAPTPPRRRVRPPRRAPARASHPFTPLRQPAEPTAPPDTHAITVRTLARNQARGLFESEVSKQDSKTVIGRAVDMRADPYGTAREVVVNLSGFLGVGDRKVNFAWRDFRFDPGAQEAPVILRAGAPIITPVTPSGKGVPPSAARLALSDITVQRPDGEPVGRVVDVVLNAKSEPQAILLDVGDSIIRGRRTVALAWGAVRFVAKPELHLETDLDDAQLKRAPAYVADKALRIVAPAAPQASSGAASGEAGVASAASLVIAKRMARAARAARKAHGARAKSAARRLRQRLATRRAKAHSKTRAARKARALRRARLACVRPAHCASAPFVAEAACAPGLSRNAALPSRREPAASDAAVSASQAAAAPHWASMRDPAGVASAPSGSSASK